uniref:Clc-like protein n=1 Tax=Angiostrongylus cantonensis TaxID=6313 RepID=A0A0K0D0N0_ANGCA
MAYGEVSKCGRRTALSTFFTATFVAFTLSVIALISPSWQYVYLENGRTEHHHGLWLDCKRDYSFDYGRTREYYETLYRRDLQGSPFDIFFLPPLQCVYKFDYYIDPEDLYDHDHDENRIQNDAYQHLFLGWKIAALSGCGVAVVSSASALLLAVCAFCHRTFICASTVLITIAAILSTIGVAVFYAWANYQDNKVIKEEEDTIYEQLLGWAFYCQVVATIIQWLAAMLGCCATSVSFSKTRAKLVKIEVVDGNDDVELLSGGHSSSQPFKRSFSAIYRVDSKSLRHWEQEYMKNAQEVPFKRTASVPNFSKKQGIPSESRKKVYQKQSRDIFSSTSNITETTHTGSTNTLEINKSSNATGAIAPPARNALSSALPALPKLKSALKTPQPSKKSVNIDDSDVTYECLPCNGSIGVSSFLGER